MDDIKSEEELKRDRHWDPRVRWNLIQEAITWAEEQAGAGKRNERQRCLLEQARKGEGGEGVQGSGFGVQEGMASMKGEVR